MRPRSPAPTFSRAQFAALDQQPEHRVRRHDPPLDLLAVPDHHHLAPHHRALISDRLQPAPRARQRGRTGAIEFGKARSEEHTSELQSLMRISYAVFCLKKKNDTYNTITDTTKPKEQNSKQQTYIQ